MSRKKYVLLLLLEAAGMGLVLWDGVPIYRHLINLERVGTFSDEVILWIAVAFIQFSYWYGLRYKSPFDFPRRPFIAHVILFVSRLSFVFASSLFAFVVYRHAADFQFQLTKVLLFVAVLFSVFCFSRHLEAIGNRLLRGSERK